MFAENRDHGAEDVLEPTSQGPAAAGAVHIIQAEGRVPDADPRTQEEDSGDTRCVADGGAEGTEIVSEIC